MDHDASDKNLNEIQQTFAGKLTIQGKLGQGAMGVVYRVECSGRPMALKLLLPGSMQDPVIRERFLLEGRILRSLRHPNILGLEDFGEIDGRPYLLGELIVGRGLDQLLAEEGPLDWKRAFTIIDQMLAGLEVAHSQKIVHRDIKPSNILVEAGDKVKIADFGIAKAEELETRKTETGIVVGTPAYIAPELLKGRKANARADIFSVGVVLYELLAGELPWPDASPEELFTARLRNIVPKLSEKMSGVPKAIDLLIVTAMATDVVERYPSARTFQLALEKTRASLLQNLEGDGSKGTAQMKVTGGARETAVVMKKRQTSTNVVNDPEALPRPTSQRIRIAAPPPKQGPPPWMLALVGVIACSTLAFMVGTHRKPAPVIARSGDREDSRPDPLNEKEEAQLQQIVRANAGQVFDEALGVLVSSQTLEKERIALVLFHACNEVREPGALQKRFAMADKLVGLESPLAIRPIVRLLSDFDQIARSAELRPRVKPLALALEKMVLGSKTVTPPDPAAYPEREGLRRDLCLIVDKVAHGEPGWQMEGHEVIRATIRTIAWLGDPRTECLDSIEMAPTAAGWLDTGLPGDDPDKEVTRALQAIGSDAAKQSLARRGGGGSLRSPATGSSPRSDPE